MQFFHVPSVFLLDQGLCLYCYAVRFYFPSFVLRCWLHCRSRLALRSSQDSMEPKAERAEFRVPSRTGRRLQSDSECSTLSLQRPHERRYSWTNAFFFKIQARTDAIHVSGLCRACTLFGKSGSLGPVFKVGLPLVFTSLLQNTSLVPSEIVGLVCCQTAVAIRAHFAGVFPTFKNHFGLFGYMESTLEVFVLLVTTRSSKARSP